MSDEKTVLRPGRRAPGAHAGVGPGLEEENCGARAFFLLPRIVWHPRFVGAPAELGWLHPLGQETFHRPGVDEHVAGFGMAGALRVALGDVDALHADELGEPSPVLTRPRFLAEAGCIASDIEQGLLDEP